MTSTASNPTLEPSHAIFELTLLNAESTSYNFDDVIVEGIKRKIPPELVTRLSELWEQTKRISGEVVAIGKIIVRKIMDFLVANPGMSGGIALGAAVTALVACVPFVGPILAPLAGTISILYGAGTGAAMQEGVHTASPITAAFTLARKFLELLISIFNGISVYWNSK